RAEWPPPRVTKDRWGRTIWRCCRSSPDGTSRTRPATQTCASTCTGRCRARPLAPSRLHTVMQFALKFELAAQDLARAKAWYSDVIGLEPVDPDDDTLVYRVGGTVFGIYPSDNAGTNKATSVRLVVDDFDAARAELLSKGVVFLEYDLGPDFRTVDGVLTSPDGERTSWFKDSEGNTLALGCSL